MASLQPKTLTPLLMLRILEEYSDEKHPLTREEIERLLDEKYGITMERKAFFRHIKSLQGLTDEGIYVYRTTVKSKDPEETACAGFYLADRTFNELELRVIIDALSGSPHLSQWETEDLVDRLASLGNRHFRKRMSSYQFIGGGKTENESLMLNLEIIDEAISEQKQIRFERLRTKNDGTKELANCGSISCTPIRYFVREHNYILVCIHEDKGELKAFSYPLSTIINVEKLDAPAQDIRTIPEFKHGVDWQKFFREHPATSWLRGKPELCTFLCFPWQINDIKRRFGNEIRIRQISNDEYETFCKIFSGKVDKSELAEVSVITDPIAAAEFSLSYTIGMWLIHPKNARKELCFFLRSRLGYWERFEQNYIKKEQRNQSKVVVRLLPRNENGTD